MTEKIYRAWHVCPTDMLTVARPDRPRMPIVKGETLAMHENDRLKPLCGSDGLHGAVMLLDALGQHSDGRICLVDIWGNIHDGGSMIAGRYRRVVRIIPQAIVAIECRFFAASVAHRLLSAEREAGCEPAAASWDAVEVARRFAIGSATASQLASAEASAWAAAWASASAWAAEAAAARAAARAAEASAWAAARTALSLELEDRLLRATGGVDG